MMQLSLSDQEVAEFWVAAHSEVIPSLAPKRYLQDFPPPALDSAW